MMSMPPPSLRRQRGAALLTAMIIVALVATLAAAMVWQQWRAVQVEAAERARTQSAWILIGARDFAGLILRENWKASPNLTALTVPWALPLKEARLSTFLAVDKANTDEGPEAFLSGYINDAQARFNLRNVVPKPGQKPEDDLDAVAALVALRRLCDTLQLDASLASRIATGLTEAINGGASAPLEPKTVAQLTWLGIDKSAVTTLEPFVIVLPETTPVNINTASKEVLAAVARIDPGSAERWVQKRQRTPYKLTAAFRTDASVSATVTDNAITVSSRYFDVSGSLRLSDHILTERSLVKRSENGIVTPFQRERIAALDQSGG